MSIADFEQGFVRLVAVETADEEGGVRSEWSQDLEFKGAIRADNFAESLRAKKQELKAVYWIIVDSELDLKYDDYVKREADGGIFRLTSFPFDMQTPKFSKLEKRAIRAERAELPK